MIKLFTDTSANLPREILERYNIGVLPFAYSVNGKEVEYSMDFDGVSFYNSMRSGAIVKTSLVNIAVFIDSFERWLKKGYDIIYVGMSGGISGTASAAANASEELREKYPERKITAIDTYAASLGEGMQVIDAANMISDGVDYYEVVETILRMRHKMCQYFTVDDLIYLHRGGRVSSTKVYISKALNIKPILKGDELGRIIVCDRARGSKNALQALAEKYGRLAADKSANIGIAHADAPDRVKQLLEMLSARGFTGDSLTVCYEPVTGSHVGPGTVALFFPGTEK